MVYTDKKSNFKSFDSNVDNTDSTVCIDSADIHSMNIHALSSVELCKLLGWDSESLTIALYQFYSGNTSLQPKIIEDCVNMLSKFHMDRFLLHNNIPLKTQEKIQKYCNQKIQNRAFLESLNI